MKQNASRTHQMICQIQVVKQNTQSSPAHPPTPRTGKKQGDVQNNNSFMKALLTWHALWKMKMVIAFAGFGDLANAQSHHPSEASSDGHFLLPLDKMNVMKGREHNRILCVPSPRGSEITGILLTHCRAEYHKRKGIRSNSSTYRSHISKLSVGQFKLKVYILSPLKGCTTKLLAVLRPG